MRWPRFLEQKFRVAKWIVGRGLSCRAERQRVEVGLIRGASVKGYVRSLCVVEGDVSTDRLSCLADTFVGMQIDFLVLDCSPEALDEDVVSPCALAVHADRDAVVGQHFDKFGTGELTALKSGTFDRKRLFSALPSPNESAGPMKAPRPFFRYAPYGAALMALSRLPAARFSAVPSLAVILPRVRSSMHFNRNFVISSDPIDSSLAIRFSISGLKLTGFFAGIFHPSPSQFIFALRPGSTTARDRSPAFLSAFMCAAIRSRLSASGRNQ